MCKQFKNILNITFVGIFQTSRLRQTHKANDSSFQSCKHSLFYLKHLKSTFVENRC